MVTVNILYADVVSAENRCYPLNEMQATVDALGDQPILSTIGMIQPASTDLISASHVASNFRIENGVMKCELKILNTPSGKLLTDMLEDNSVVFRPAGYGTLVEREDGVREVTNFTLTQVGAIPREDDPYATYEPAHN